MTDTIAETTDVTFKHEVRCVLQIIRSSRELHVLPDIASIWQQCPMDMAIAFLREAGELVASLRPSECEDEDQLVRRRLELVSLCLKDTGATLTQWSRSRCVSQRAFPHSNTKEKKLRHAVWASFKTYSGAIEEGLDSRDPKLASRTFLRWLIDLGSRSSVWLYALPDVIAKWQASLILAYLAIQPEVVSVSIFDQKRYNPAVVYAANSEGRALAHAQAQDFLARAQDVEEDWQNAGAEAALLGSAIEAKLTQAVLELVVARKNALSDYKSGKSGISS